MMTFSDFTKVLIVSTALAGATADAKTLTIALDKSGSNPLLVDPHFAASAADYASELIMPLEEGDVVRLVSFGARDRADNMLNKIIKLKRSLRAGKVADAVKSYINGLPQGEPVAQSSTNIVSFLELDGNFDCKSGSTVLLLTDGVEASEYVSPQGFVEGKSHLPKPDPELSLKGCTVIFYGLGAGTEGSAAKFMRNEWSAYVGATGGEFTAVTK
tara:strand:- start:853 stop:1497 length:645 start_codon:yes stop_codon:yes gene_type:complete